MSIPKINLLYFKNILDEVMRSFFSDANDMFVRDGDKYVFAEGIDYSRLYKYFKPKIISCIRKYVKPYSKSQPEYYFIIGSCYPRDNILLKFRHDSYFPAKLSKLVFSDYSKYILAESDIKVDMNLFTGVFIDIFMSFFSSKSAILKDFGISYMNMIFINHAKLDCYSMFKVLKYIYGPANCINVYTTKFDQTNKCLIAINDLIDKYVVNKKEMNKSKEFKRIVDEVRDYSNSCINSLYE